MTQFEDIRETVGGSDPSDWIPFADMGVWTFADDVSLRIRRYEQLDANLHAPWTKHRQAPTQNYSYIVYYDNSPVEYHQIASVDNFRAHIPVPQQPQDPDEPYTITPYQATIGRIVTGDARTFEAYLNNTGIEIRE
jgi:hypothetical protein